MDEEFTDIFIEQLELKLKESYSFLNVDEIEYAFRNYRIDNYGKNFNIHTFDAVIEKYLQDRKEVDQYDKVEPAQIHNVVEQTDEELMNEVIEYSKKDYRGKKLHLLPLFIYDNLVKFNLIDLSEKAKIKKFNEAINFYEKELQIKANGFDHNAMKEYQSFMRLREYNFDNISKQLTLTLDSLHKKLYCLEYFNKLAEAEKESTGHVQ